MSVDDSTVIDFIGIDKVTSDVVLTIADHLEWDDLHGHFDMLHKKVEVYLTFCASGELAQQYPASVGRSISVLVLLKCEPPPESIEFINRLVTGCERAGLNLVVKHAPK